MNYFPYKKTHLEKGEGETYYVVYEAPHEYRGGHEHLRTRSKEVYVSGKNARFDTEPKTRENRQGNPVYGIEVKYDNPVSGFQATRKATGTTYHTGEKTVEVTNVIPVPKDARNIRVQKNPPKSHQEVA